MKKILQILAIITLGLLSGCSNQENVLVMGTSLDYPPYEFSKNGEAMGFDIDVARAIASELGYELVIKDISFSSLIPALKTGQVDFIMAGLSESEERKKNVDFSNMYYKSDKNALVTQKGKEIENMENKKIGTQQGSVQEAYLKDLKSHNKVLHIVALYNNMLLIQELKIGRIDALILPKIQAKKFVESNPELTYTEINSAQQGVSIAFKKKSKLTAMFNEALEKIKNKGELKELKDQWFK